MSDPAAGSAGMSPPAWRKTIGALLGDRVLPARGADVSAAVTPAPAPAPGTSRGRLAVGIGRRARLLGLTGQRSGINRRAGTFALKFLRLLGPMLGSNLVQALAGTVNGIYVGHLLGTLSYAAVSVFMPLSLLLAAVVIGVSSGSTILAGRACGARDFLRLRQVGQTALTFGCIAGIGMGAAGYWMAPNIIAALGTPLEVRPAATAYARMMFAALPVQFFVMTLTALLRGTGDARTPFRAAIATLIATVVVTPMLIRWTSIGATAAALSYLIAQLTAGAWMVWQLKRTDHHLFGVFVSEWRASRSVLKQQVQLGLPLILFFLAGSAADLGLLALVNSHGTAATAAWGVVRQIINYVQLPGASIAIATSILAAHAFGAGKRDRLAAIWRVSMLLNLAIIGAAAVVVATAAPWLVSLFVGDQAVREVAIQVLRIIVWGSIALGIASALTAFMRATGAVLVPTAISLSCTLLLLYPVAFLLETRMGYVGIWLAYPVTYAAVMSIQFVYFISAAKGFDPWTCVNRCTEPPEHGSKSEQRPLLAAPPLEGKLYALQAEERSSSKPISERCKW